MQNNTERGTTPRIVGQRRLSSTKGIAAIDLIITVVLVSFVVGLATPVYYDAIERQEIEVALKQIATFVNAAKSESIKRNKLVAVSFGNQAGGRWCMGATLGKKPCDCGQMIPASPGFCAIASSAWLLRDTDILTTKSISALAEDGSFTFDPVRGILVNRVDSLVLGLHAGQGQFKMNLHMLATGRMSLCRQSVSDQGEWIESCSPATTPL